MPVGWKGRPGGLASHALAVAAAVAAALLRLALDPYFGERSPFLLFTPVVLAAALLGGVGPAATATATGLVLGLWMFVGARFGFSPLTVPEVTNALAFLAVSAVAVALARAVARQRTRAETGEAGEARAEARFQALVETVPDHAIFLVGPDGRILTWNTGARRATGYAAEEVVGRPLEILYPADARASACPARALDAAAEGGHHREEGWRRRKDGSLFLADMSVTALRDPARGGLLGFAQVVADITERKGVEEALRRGERLLRGVIDGATDPIFAKDRDGRLILLNDATASALGVSAAAAVGKRDADFLPPAGAAAIEAADRRVMEGGVPLVVEEELPTAGGPRTYLSTKAPLRDGEGRVVGLVGVARDITDRKRAEAALRASEAEVRELNRTLEARVVERTGQLAELNAELEAFAHTVAHDLRAPLRAMSGLAQALEEDYRPGSTLDATAAEYLRRVAAAARRMDALIVDLLSYARLGREAVALAPLALGQAVSDALLQVGGEVAGRGARIDVAPDMPRVMAHRAVLVQVVANLLSNAVKFVPPGRVPEVRVRAEPRDGGCVRLWVRDNGIGIPPAHRDRVFSVFERLHGVAEYPGTGIGLAIVRRGAGRMGGSAGVEEAPGGGSAFWVDLREAVDG